MGRHSGIWRYRNSRVGRYQVQITGNPPVLFGDHASMIFPIRLTFAIFILVQLLPSATRTARANDFPSQALTPTVAGVGWTTVTLADLIKRSKSDCIVESVRLITCTGPLHLDALSKTSVLGGGVEIQFTNPQAGKGGFVLTGAENIVLSNFMIGWLGGGARDPIVVGVDRIQSFGYVTACANHEPGGMLTLDLPLEGRQPLGSASVWSDTMGWPWYPAAPKTFEVYFPAGATANFFEGKSGCIPRLAALVGHRALLRHIVSSNHAFLCWGCQNVTVRQVRVTSAPGMAFVFGNGGSNFSLIDDVVEPKCAPSCALPEPSTTADASHFSNVAGNILLENNDFGWQGDDGVNITGLLVPSTLDLRVPNAKRRLNVVEAWQGRLDSMAVGSSVSLFDASLSALGEAKVVAVNPATGMIELSSLPADVTDFILARTDGIPKNVVIRNNHFHSNRARGILLGGSNALIENNRIERVTMEGILVPADTGPWYEGPGAQHVIITGNYFFNVNRFPAAVYPSAISTGVSMPAGYAAAISVSPIQDVLVEGNSFTDVYTNANNPVSIGRGSSAAPIP